MMRKKIILIILLSFITLTPINTNAKTLGQLKREYNELERKYNETKNNINANKSEQNAAKNRIQSIYGEIDSAKKEVEKTNSEINELNEDIKKKQIEIKDLMRFFQVSEGESTYLEYIFKADSITDFIYRLSVTEQLSTYNNGLISEMNSMITEKNNHIVKLKEKEKELANLQEELKQKLVILSEQAEDLYEEEDNIEKDIKYNKEIINYYIKSGCKESEDISTCANKQLPVGTEFWRPLNKGIMFSTWWTDTLSGGGCRSHAGVDIANNCGTPIYAAATGKVVVASYSNDGYGNKVVINHNINGRNYTTLYGHMSSISVSKNQIVTKDTVIGYVGNTGRSQGCHLHLNICSGIKACIVRGDTIDPGTKINFPANKVWFYDRTTYYSGYYSNPCR